MANKFLSVGINAYPGTGLTGCVNDANGVYNALSSLKKRPGIFRPDMYFPARSGTKLLDAAGTKDNILANWRAVIQQAQPGDHIVIFESGHGARLTDTGGDETDSYDEGGVSVDMRFVSDDERAAILALAQPGVIIEIVLDQCHSGGSTSPRLLGKSFTKKFMSESEYYANGGSRPDQISISEKLLQVIAEGNHCLWAGCAPDSYSVEMTIDGIRQGLFTHWFRESMVHNRAFTRAQHMAYISQHVEAEGVGQVPQMECTQEVANTVPFPLL